MTRSTHSSPLTRSLSAVAVTGGLVFGLVACSPSVAEEAAGDDGGSAAGTVEVTGLDYGFDLASDDLTAGTTLTFRNDSEVEFHEVAVMRLADDEERSVDELLALPPEEAMAAMTFVGVAGAAPTEAGEVVDGDLTLTEAGRYVLTCFIPQGADPAVVEEAFFGEPGEDGPPELGDGTPHAMLGMVREITVTD